MWMQKKLKTILLVLVALAFLGCNDAGFRSEAVRKVEPAVHQEPPPTSAPGTPFVPGTPTTQGFTAPCSDTPMQQSLVGGQGSTAQVNGQICPTSYANLKVLFVVDFSGSMKEEDPWRFLSCGRAKAANAIIKHINNNKSVNDQVEIAMVSFDTDAALRMNWRDSKSFGTAWNWLTFCGHKNGWTNYKRAFEVAGQALQGKSGNTIMYFISDGAPTAGAGTPQQEAIGGPHHQAGLAAMESLRAAHPGLVVNAIYLSSAEYGGTPQFDYLAQLTQDRNRVKIAATADQLADRILETAMVDVTVNQATRRAELLAPGQAARPVNIESFTQDPAARHIWNFRTAPFQLHGSVGAPVQNTLRVIVEDMNGATHQSLFEISYNQLTGN